MSGVELQMCKILVLGLKVWVKEIVNLLVCQGFPDSCRSWMIVSLIAEAVLSIVCLGVVSVTSVFVCLLI